MYEKIFIIDDDKKLNALLKDYLSKFGFYIYSEINPKKELIKLKRELPDIIILDVMLPDIEGFELCKKIRELYSVPIIMLTARGEVSDRILGLELGADDYLPKPFEPRELVARIQSILRRNNPENKIDKIRIKDLEVDYKKQIAEIKGRDLKLTSMEFALLDLFVQSPGRVFSRDLIMEKLQGRELSMFNRSLDILISRLRKKINDDPKNPEYLKTVWGSGYMFIEE